MSRASGCCFLRPPLFFCLPFFESPCAGLGTPPEQRGDRYNDRESQKTRGRGHGTRDTPTQARTHLGHNTGHRARHERANTPRTPRETSLLFVCVATFARRPYRTPCFFFTFLKPNTRKTNSTKFRNYGTPQVWWPKVGTSLLEMVA